MRTRATSEKKRKKRIPLRVKWSFAICLAVFLSLAATILFMYKTVGDMLEKDDNQSNKSNAGMTVDQVRMNLQTFEQSAEELSAIVSNQLKEKNAIPAIESLMKTVEENNELIMSAYFMDWKTGKIHISPYADFNKDVRETRTYKQLSKHKKTLWMDVYREEGSNKVMTSIITPVMSNGKMVGGLGYDVDLSTIGEAREKIEKSTGNKLAILDAQGVIVSSFIEGSDGKNMNPAKSGEIAGVEDVMKDSADFHSQFSWITDLYKKEDRPHTFTWKGKEYKAHTSTIPELNWKVISFTPQSVFASKMKDIQQTGMLSMAVGLLIGILFAMFLARKLVQIISNLRRTLNKTAEGNLQEQFIVQSNDEIGDLSVSYNQMIDKMRDLIQQVERNVQRVNESTVGLNTIAAENSSAIANASRSVEEIANGAGHQTEEIERGVGTIQSLNWEIDQLLEQAQSTERALDAASGQLENASGKVRQLSDSSNLLEQAFQKVTRLVAALNEKSKSISEVTSAISQISEQTNLLSLNASIEAARAGEHGKGFAVVAHEVRSLAEQSKSSAEDIQQTINRVLVETEELVQVMAETNRISDEQKKAVQSVTQSNEQLMAFMQNMIQIIQKETNSIDKLQVQKDHIVKAIERISAVSQETAATSEEIAASMEEQAASSNELAQHAAQLAQHTEQLQEAIHQFKI
ncbi:methyl-accepting chemotaxis protein [Pseudobacillus sp. FSL P4-0506]|uniref:methyl-accepting chemotaxis protein n=1 Tax=Pseudobacillus sp. FSL P4-0506 TaxID=2921576 RepID=UPI0030F5ED8D